MSSCNSCPSNGSCNKEQSNCSVENNPLNKINKIIGVMSGKGGVGKSTVSALIAKNLAKQGHKVGVLDADITGPSIPRLLGVDKQRARASEEFIYPAVTEDGIKVMSLNLLIENEEEPVIWRGAMVSNAVKQFYKDVLWEELDYLIIDMPPGTGDVALTVMQSLPLTGMIMVSVPQDMISMIVAKGVNMAKMLNVNILGIVENMSYIECPDCNKKIKLFDGEETDEFLQENDLDLLGELPMTREIVEITHKGVETVSDELDNILTGIVEKINKKISK